MESLSRIATPTAIEKAPQSSDKISLLTPSTRQLPAPQVHALGVLMKQVKARYPNQELPNGTTDMYLMEWSGIAVRYGLLTFRDGLSRAIGESEFFPDPRAIAEHCQATARTEREREAARNYLDKLAELKAQCERERAEELANGPREKSETELRLEAILAAAREDKKKVTYYGPPAVVMTPEEIRASVERERARTK